MSKSPEEVLEDAQQQTVKLHRESILWYLKRKLEDAAEIQSGISCNHVSVGTDG